MPRILLVEDDRTTSKSVELMLTHAGMNVYATDHGGDGVSLAKLYNYDLILLDLGLPDIPGHEVLRQIRLLKVNTPIMALTGDDSTESKIIFYGLGGDDYMTKPFHREELVARVNARIKNATE